jgi:hypothetical protein
MQARLRVSKQPQQSCWPSRGARRRELPCSGQKIGRGNLERWVPLNLAPRAHEACGDRPDLSITAQPYLEACKGIAESLHGLYQHRRENCGTVSALFKCVSVFHVRSSSWRPDTRSHRESAMVYVRLSVGRGSPTNPDPGLDGVE